MTDEQRKLRKFALQLLIQSEADVVEWHEVEKTGVRVQLQAFWQQQAHMTPRPTWDGYRLLTVTTTPRPTKDGYKLCGW